MNTTVLNQAIERATALTKAEKELQQTRKEQIQRDIGVELFAAAKRELPKLERFVTETVLPWRLVLEQIAVEHARRNPPQYVGLPVLMATKEMDQLQGAPGAVARGIADYEAVVPPLARHDSRFEDLNMRTVLINGIRASLRSYEGTQPRLALLMEQAERWLKEAGWTHAQESEAVA